VTPDRRPRRSKSISLLSLDRDQAADRNATVNQLDRGLSEPGFRENGVVVIAEQRLHVLDARGEIASRAAHYRHNCLRRIPASFRENPDPVEFFVRRATLGIGHGGTQLQPPPAHEPSSEANGGAVRVLAYVRRDRRLGRVRDQCVEGAVVVRRSQRLEERMPCQAPRVGQLDLKVGRRALIDFRQLKDAGGEPSAEDIEIAHRADCATQPSKLLTQLPCGVVVEKATEAAKPVVVSTSISWNCLWV
jgi:hypothetical protein